MIAILIKGFGEAKYSRCLFCDKMEPSCIKSPSNEWTCEISFYSNGFKVYHVPVYNNKELCEEYFEDLCQQLIDKGKLLINDYDIEDKLAEWQEKGLVKLTKKTSIKA